ncbi:alpha/beta fold hydrolase [Actinomycetospora sp. TBRC 11914]|uniref:alpha/beta fold hydrolase n=1 Tax=Actinomycetospora sp. TBRC 11914 TaxID=2729387 RepID=UPI00145F9AB2|nr:alpha/beta fold hydrolase [Actinomycetospora sp. TBRC 11914]NMO92173.1 alpha/beta hydrolase [Actinomycetospora sp. TBRC 11914]
MTHADNVVRPDGTTLAVETRGHDDHPPVLLIAGSRCSRDWWDDEFCDHLAGTGLRVARYDARDTGGSTHWPVGAPSYTAADLRADALAVVDALGAGRAHVVGLSMGGGIAQHLALRSPERVASLTLVATTGVGPLPGPLPRMSPEVRAALAGLPEPDPADPEAAVAALVAGERLAAGAGTFDEDRIRAIARRVVARSRDLAAAANHDLLTDPDDGPADLAALAEIPTLVVHGARDPFFPPAHGRALAAAIPGARLLEVPDMGHGLPPTASWPAVVDSVTELVRTTAVPR